MNARHRILCSLVLFFAAAGAAQADLTAFWQHNPITPQAISNDPSLANMQSWSVMITHTNGYWTSAGARLTLPAGFNFYRNPFGGSTRPSLAAINANPALEFHTYITSPHQIFGNHSPSVINGFPDGTVSFGGPLDSIPGIFSVSWGHPEATNWPTPVGTYEIMRGTFPMGVLPTLHAQSRTSVVVPDQTAFIPSIPEPPILGLAVAAAALTLRGAKRGGEKGDILLFAACVLGTLSRWDSLVKSRMSPFLPFSGDFQKANRSASVVPAIPFPGLSPSHGATQSGNTPLVRTNSRA